MSDLHVSKNLLFWLMFWSCVVISLKVNMVASILDILLKKYPEADFFQVKTKIRDNIIYLFIYDLLSHVQSDGWKTSATPTQVFDLINFLTNTLVQQIHLVVLIVFAFSSKIHYNLRMFILVLHLFPKINLRCQQWWKKLHLLSILRLLCMFYKRASPLHHLKDFKVIKSSSL